MGIYMVVTALDASTCGELHVGHSPSFVDLWGPTVKTYMWVTALHSSTCADLHGGHSARCVDLWRLTCGAQPSQFSRFAAVGVKPPQDPSPNNLSSHLIVTAKWGPLDQMLFFQRC